MPTIKTRDKAMFLGGYRQGKTTGAKILMRGHVARGGRFAWYDVPWEARDVDAGAIVTSKLADVEPALKAGKNVVYQAPGGGTREDMDAFVAICNRVRNIIVVVDEAHNFMSHSTAAEKIPNFNRLVRLGHKFGRGLWVISHRVSDFPGSVRNVHHVFHFKTFVALDIEASRELFGELADQLKTMPQFHFLYFGPDQGAMLCKPLPLTNGSGSTEAKEARENPTEAGTEVGTEVNGSANGSANGSGNGSASTSDRSAERK